MPEYSPIDLILSLDESLRIRITDDGCGISKEDLPHIFDPFYQGTAGLSQIGSGLGLSLSKQLVGAMRGTIDIDSKEGIGTTVVIMLPLSQDDVQVLELVEEVPDVNNVLSADGEDLVDKDDSESVPRILIVEDNNDVSLFIGSVIENSNVYYAPNGKIGLEKALRLVPDIIITDIMMPEMNGIEMCKKIRQSEILSHIPIIVISAKATDDDKIEGIKQGVDAYLYKPFNAAELNATILTLLERRKSIQENVLRNIGHDEVASNDVTASDQLFLNKVIDVIYTQMSQLQVSINGLAYTLNMTPKQLNRKINAIVGVTASRYVLQIRMTRAKQLLDSNKNYSIADVALKCGYEENGNFTRAFKALYNITPTQYRKTPDL